MNILSRSEIITLFKSGELKIETPDNFYESEANAVYSKNNPFQQCSLDLHVGSIFIPETKDSDLGGMLHPRTDDYVLHTGSTVLVKTREKITLPNNVGAICFSPSIMALKGIMITNMGHVDPGYSGHLHYTAINMGKGEYGLKVNTETICTVILFKLSSNVQPYGEGYTMQHPTSHGSTDVASSIYYSLPKLAKDFVNVEKRAKEVAKDIFRFSVVFSFLTAIIVAAFPIYQVFVTKPWEEEANKANNKIEALEKSIDYNKRLMELEKKSDYDKRLVTLENKFDQMTTKKKKHQYND